MINLPFVISIAQPADMPQVLECIKELAVFENEPNAVMIDSKTLEEFGTGDTPLFTCFVAKHHQTIVGIALVYFRFSTWAGKCLHLEDLIVKKEYRAQGIGGALYDRVMQYGHAQNVKRISWEVLDWNQTAIDFYTHRGAKILKEWNLVQVDASSLHQYVNTLANK